MPYNIKDKLFEKCTILGPAVVAFSGNNILQLCSIESPSNNSDAVLLESKGPMTIGEIGLKNCHFKECTFVFVSFVMTKDQESYFIENVKPVQLSP